MKDRWSDIGRLVAERREELRISKAEAARRAQVSPTTWRAIETGAHPVESSTLIRVTRALHLNPAEVLAMVDRIYYPPSQIGLPPQVGPATAGIAPTLPKCGACYQVVCRVHKMVLEQCRCTKALLPEEREYVDCPGGCWEGSEGRRSRWGRR